MSQIQLQVVSDQNKELKKRVLAVEDDPTSLLVLSGLLESMGYDVIESDSGQDALNIIEREAHSIDVVVLDKVMPEMDGLDVVEVLKQDLNAKHIPIVMVTGSAQSHEVREGINAGVFYYLTKPYEDDVLESVMQSAMRETNKRKMLRTELRKHQSSFGFIDQASFTIRTLDEAENLACFIANCFPEPDIALPGLAALMVNAVEHGNLGIGYDEKSHLLAQGEWRAEIEGRQSLPGYDQKTVRVQLSATEDHVSVRIADQGDGFDWIRFMEIDPARALDSHGRGIAQANKISFDHVEYNEKGNEVTVRSLKTSGIEW